MPTLSSAAVVPRTPLLIGSPVAAAGAGTFYIPIGGTYPSATLAATERLVQLIAPCAGTLRNFRARTLTAMGAAQSAVLTVRKNEADTALVVSFANNAPIDTEATDTADSVAVAAGDRLDVKIVSTGVAAPNTFSGGIEFGNS